MLQKDLNALCSAIDPRIIQSICKKNLEYKLVKPIVNQTCPPRVFTFWVGPKPPIIELCLRSIQINIPNSEQWTLEQWESVYDGKLGPWERIVNRPPNTQSDLLRYWLLSTYGGIWLDADCIAFRDVRAVWDADADYIGYCCEGKECPYTALMGGHPNSPVVDALCKRARTFVKGHPALNIFAGPQLTLAALRDCPDASIIIIERNLLHPIIWKQYFKNLYNGNINPYAPLDFHPNALGLMLHRRVIAAYRSMSEKQLMTNSTAIGQALRKALESA
jgi:hypothetical protein